MAQISALGSYKTTLIMTDDDLYIYSSKGTGAELAGVVPWDDGNFAEKALSIISQRCGSKPLIVLNDMSEQFYKVDKLPDIKNPLDRNSLIKRKLVAAFPQYKITGALIQSDKLKGSKVKNFRTVMAAIPSSQKMQKVNNVLNFSGLQILGVGLLPVESASLVHELSQSMNKNKDKTKNNWTIFVAQNANGGLRQIVTKNGDMALTRMTPLVNTDEEPEVWASEVSQELKATMTYLTRFDYKQDENLEVILVSNPTAGQILEGLIDVSCNFYSLSVTQVSERLKIKPHSPEEMRYMDSIHARWSANKINFDMNMMPEEVGIISKARLGAVAASVLMAFSLLYFSSGAYATYSDLSQTKQDIVRAKSNKNSADIAYNEAVKNSDATEYDINLIKGTVDSYEEFGNAGILPTKYIAKINKAMSKFTQTFSDIEMNISSNTKQGNQSTGRSANAVRDTDLKKGEVEIKLKMVFPGSVAPEKGNELVERIRRSLEQEFSDIEYNVEITKFLRDMTFESAFEGSAGIRPQAGKVTSSFSSEILISGSLI